MDGLPDHYCDIVQECIENNLTKDKTQRYAHDVHQIPPHHTDRVWNHLESTNPDLFTAYYARMREHNERMREHNERMRERHAKIPPPVAQPSPPEVTSARRRKPRRTKKEDRLSPPPACRPLLPDLNVRVASPQEAAAYANAVYPSTQAGPSRAANANAIENQNLQASQQQQPVFPNDFCQQVLNALGQIIKLLSDGHGLGPHPSATGSLKRKRVGENEERGENEEEEKHQKNEGDGNEEAEKLQDNEEGNGGEAEKLQENERDGDEEAEKQITEKEEGNDEEMQKNDSASDEEAEKQQD